MEINIRKITPREAVAAEKYIRTEGSKPKFMTKAEMSEMTGLPVGKCSRIIDTLKKSGLIQMQYAIYCPECGHLVQRQSYAHGIKRSGYTCPWCSGKVDYRKENLGRIYAPWDTQRTNELKTIRLVSAADMEKGDVL